MMMKFAGWDVSTDREWVCERKGRRRKERRRLETGRG